MWHKSDTPSNSQRGVLLVEHASHTNSINVYNQRPNKKMRRLHNISESLFTELELPCFDCKTTNSKVNYFSSHIWIRDPRTIWFEPIRNYPTFPGHDPDREVWNRSRNGQFGPRTYWFWSVDPWYKSYNMIYASETVHSLW